MPVPRVWRGRAPALVSLITSVPGRGFLALSGDRSCWVDLLGDLLDACWTVSADGAGGFFYATATTASRWFYRPRDPADCPAPLAPALPPLSLLVMRPKPGQRGTGTPRWCPRSAPAMRPGSAAAAGALAVAEAIISVSRIACSAAWGTPGRARLHVTALRAAPSPGR